MPFKYTRTRALLAASVETTGEAYESTRRFFRSRKIVTNYKAYRVLAEAQQHEDECHEGEIGHDCEECNDYNTAIICGVSVAQAQLARATQQNQTRNLF